MSNQHDGESGATGGLAALAARVAGSHRTLSQLAYAVIREGIMRGVFLPGEWLRQESLAEQLEISRVPVRAALVQLEAEGLVDLISHKGARVKLLTAAQVMEIYQLRTVLETYAIRLAAPKLTEAKLKRLRNLARKLDTFGHRSEAGHLASRVEFYDLLYDKDANPLLTHMITELRSQVGRYLVASPFSSRHAHTELIDLLAARDVAGAEAWVASHLDDVRLGIESRLSGKFVEHTVHGRARRSSKH